MRYIIVTGALSMLLAGCGPVSEQFTDQATKACQRAEVQDVVGKEVRNQMLSQADGNRLFWAAMVGIDFAKAFEDARVRFSDVGTYTPTALITGTRLQQVVCGGSMQIDASSTRFGQDIITMPHLRWSINFTEPTDDPEHASFTIAIDKQSIGNGLLVNGAPPQSQSRDDQPEAAKEESGPPPDQALGDAQSAEEAAAQAKTSADDAAKDAREAAAAAVEKPSAQGSPSEDDLYAPHNN
ncbi:hypothetical protein NSE01_35450 [Novosphingobium sediminis]|uniref:Lipoprotein n=1 Tax=Novosphingobium sediminis TaxID=707214 RepID=A0A512APT3_9SPHN|nr:hypothetical protein [Novosphingobium sediminis]GEO01713.1 hypothetical protein NSE01_35450 [Novosphingobium sediminis]